MVDMVALTDLATGTVVDVNEEFVRRTGYAREEAIGKNNNELPLWGNLTERREFFQLIASQGYVRGMEADLRTKSGDLIPALVSSVVTEFEGNRCAVTVIRDISTLKEAEQRLRDGEETLRRIFDANTDALT